ncbi:MAG: AAA family ATPase [bacterium]|nr:AAA family ATPase [bacterium]
MKSTFEQIRISLASAYPLTLLVSQEEERLQRLLQRFAEKARPEPLNLAVWNCVDGFVEGGPEGLDDPMAALNWVASDAPRGMYMFKDLGEYLNDRKLVRRIRDTAMKIRGSGRYLFLLSHTAELPGILKPLTYVVISLFPDESEILQLVNTLVPKEKTDPSLTHRLVTYLKGMSLTEVEHLLRRLIGPQTTLNDEFFRAVLSEKEQITRKEGILEFVPPDESLGQIGGLDQLKDWVAEREGLYSQEAQKKGLPAPKGVLLMGISGCGKSLAIKVIAKEWQLPLFRLDMNLVFAGVHGSAEWVFHRALDAVESLAPAVLWIDEIEMGIGSYSDGDTGSTAHIFSTFLTCRSTATRSLSPPQQTGSTFFPRRLFAKGVSMRCSSSTSPTKRSERKSSAFTFRGTTSIPRATT